MNRRGFLQSILALAAAPAIVRADSLMRIVPRELTIIPVEIAEDQWVHVTVQRVGAAMSYYIDGTEVFGPPAINGEPVEPKLWEIAREAGHNRELLKEDWTIESFVKKPLIVPWAVIHEGPNIVLGDLRISNIARFSR